MESKKTKICKHCKKTFNPYNTMQKYCSRDCFNKSQIKERKGKSNPNYKSGFYAFKSGAKRQQTGQRLFTKNAKMIESAMIDEAGYKYCQFCGTSQKIKFERHHIIYRSEKPGHPNLHDSVNCLIVCIVCHNLLHTHKHLRNDIVKSRGLVKIFGNDIMKKNNL